MEIIFITNKPSIDSRVLTAFLFLAIIKLVICIVQLDNRIEKLTLLYLPIDHSKILFVNLNSNNKISIPFKIRLVSVTLMGSSVYFNINIRFGFPNFARLALPLGKQLLHIVSRIRVSFILVFSYDRPTSGQRPPFPFSLCEAVCGQPLSQMLSSSRHLLLGPPQRLMRIRLTHKINSQIEITYYLNSYKQVAKQTCDDYKEVGECPNHKMLLYSSPIKVTLTVTLILVK